jgi:hypothetical protein
VFDDWFCVSCSNQAWPPRSESRSGFVLPAERLLPIRTTSCPAVMDAGGVTETEVAVPGSVLSAGETAEPK